jgi:hypothetical protein
MSELIFSQGREKNFKILPLSVICKLFDKALVLAMASGGFGPESFRDAFKSSRLYLNQLSQL